MGQIRHGSTTTTQAVRAAIQGSQPSLMALSKEFGINPKTVAEASDYRGSEHSSQTAMLNGFV